MRYLPLGPVLLLLNVPANAFDFTITNLAGVAPARLARLEATAEQAGDAFEQAAGRKLAFAVAIRVGGHCARNGYDFETREVVFCDTKTVRALGLESPDVIRHELFHAFTCALRGEACRERALLTQAILEGTADYFAYRMSPAEHFGAHYATDRPYLRRYRTSLCFALTEGSHGKGNALVSSLVTADVPLSRVVAFFLSDRPFTPEGLLGEDIPACLRTGEGPSVEVAARPGPPSRLNRYWLTPGSPLELRFAPDPETKALYPHFSVAWRTNARGRATVTPTGELTFRVEALRPGVQIFTARYLADGVEIGSRTFHFGVRDKSKLR